MPTRSASPFIVAFAVAASFLATGAATPVAAKSLRAKLKPYCMSDYVRLCDASDTTRASIVSCFKRNIGSVSPRCKRAVDRNTEFDSDAIEQRRN